MNKKTKMAATGKTSKTSKLSPKQKVMDKNKNGKLDASDFKMLRKQKK